MTAKLRTSPAGRKFIKAFEGFRRKSAPLPGGGWVVGYGHTKSAREGVSISEDDADKLLIYDLIPVEEALNEHVAAPLTQNQFDALASFTLNIGRDNFLDSTVLKRLNQNRPLEAALAFDQWRDTVLDGRQVVVEALLRRRAAERALFLTPPGGQAPAPTPEVAPIAEDQPAGLILPVVSYKADLGAPEAGGTFFVVQGVEPPEPAETPAPSEDEPETADEAVPVPAEPEIEAEPEAGIEAEFELEAESNEAPAEEPEAEDAAPRAEAALDEGEDTIAFTPDENAEADAELVPDEGALGRAESALTEDEAVEEIILDLDGEDDPADQAGEDEAADEDGEEQGPEQGELSWAEMARRRAQAARQAGPVSPPPATREDLPVRRSEAEWALEDESEYSPDKDRAGAVWYVLFLVIGAGMASFGALDSWQRSTGQVDESFLYGPLIAAFGVLFMVITGWFLIKRILAFR